MRSLAIAFSMYSKIPMPQFAWREEDMRYVMVFFPLVGLVIGILESIILWGMHYLGFPRLAQMMLLFILPIVLTGGIHVDGFLDSSDAFSSYREREEKIRILKDPHTGAFALIALLSYVLLVLLGLDLLLERGGGSGKIGGGLDWKSIFCLAGIFWYSRILSAFSVISFPAMSREGSLVTFANVASKRCVLASLLVQLLLLLSAMISLSLPMTILILVSGFLSFLYYYWRSKKIFGGINGDLAGYFVCIAELAMLLSGALYLFFVR